MAKQKGKIITKLRNKHRFVLINDSTFAEVFSIRLTLLNVLMLVSGFVLLLVLVLGFLLANTSVGLFLLGDAGLNSRAELLELNSRLEKTTQNLESERMKTQTLQNLLNDKANLYDSSHLDRQYSFE
ncbi:MAG: hypothetical protein ACO3GK_03560 [Bacteroidia bacterium]